MRRDTTTRRRSRHARRNRGPLGKRDPKWVDQFLPIFRCRPAHWEATTMDVIGGPVEILAAADTAGEADDVKRFSMMAYGGGLVKPMNSPGKTVFDLAGMDTAGQRPALLHHRAEQLVGHTEAIENTGREIRATGVISGGTQSDPAPRSMRHAKSMNREMPRRPSNLRTVYVTRTLGGVRNLHRVTGSFRGAA